MVNIYMVYIYNIYIFMVNLYINGAYLNFSFVWQECCGIDLNINAITKYYKLLKKK